MAEPPSAGPNGSVSSPNTLNGTVIDAKAGEKMAKWTLADDEVMFDVLLDAKARAGISHNGFSRETWQEVADAVTRCTTVGGKKDIENCKSRWQRLRKDYKAIRWIKDQPGFTWDVENSVLFAGEESWEIWLGEHPEHQKYRVYRFPQYDALATIADDDLPPGHLPVRPRPRPGGMFSHITGSSAPTFSHSPFSSIQPTAPFTPPHILQQPQSSVQPVAHYVDPNISGPSSRPSHRRTSPTSDEEVEESIGENGRDDNSARLASRYSRKRRRVSSPEPADRHIGRSRMRFDELLSQPMAEALFSLKETADDYVTLLRGKRSTDILDESSNTPLSHDRRSTAIHLLLETERANSFDGEELESEREGLSDEDIARVIHVFQCDLVSADTYVQLAQKGESVAGIRKKWVEQLLSNG